MLRDKNRSMEIEIDDKKYRVYYEDHKEIPGSNDPDSARFGPDEPAYVEVWKVEEIRQCRSCGVREFREIDADGKLIDSLSEKVAVTLDGEADFGQEDEAERRAEARAEALAD